MTTIVSLAARDFIAVGCDSLATMSYHLVNPEDLSAPFFEANGDLKVDTAGQPLLKNIGDVWRASHPMPVNQFPSVTKLYNLSPMNACALFAGASRIGKTTIRAMIEAFCINAEFKKKAKTATMQWLAESLRDSISKLYDSEIPEKRFRPSMELILSGYSAGHDEPEIWRLEFNHIPHNDTFEAHARNQIPRGQYNVVFGGQFDVIQRIVNGIDTPSHFSLRQRAAQSLDKYHDEILAQIQAANPGIVIQKPNFLDDKYSIFGNDKGGVTRLYPDCGSLSAQAGIDFVYFLIHVMIRAQEFSSSIPTVGGKIHVALLRKNTNFHWISKESFTFENEHIPINKNA